MGITQLFSRIFVHRRAQDKQTRLKSKLQFALSQNQVPPRSEILSDARTDASFRHLPARPVAPDAVIEPQQPPSSSPD
ncbi:hypothetical protein VV869_07635 [Photobacterium sp. MCCC 1A19761]|uniref:hypothetical protein n=1 Tax=Photobacterium sp. MCCC 1A19761 TaxID=3115000 RepID=UPI00307FA68C